MKRSWKKKLQENREIISKQLKGFSEVISSIVHDINNKKEEKKVSKKRTPAKAENVEETTEENA